MRVLLAILLGFMATAAEAQLAWDPPMDKPAVLRQARAFSLRGDLVPVFRDGQAAVDAWFSGSRAAIALTPAQEATVLCSVPNNAPMTVARILLENGQPLFATVRADGIPGCQGVVFFQDIRLVSADEGQPPAAPPAPIRPR